MLKQSGNTWFYIKKTLSIILYFERSINKTYCLYKLQYNYVFNTYKIYVATNAGGRGSGNVVEERRKIDGGVGNAELSANPVAVSLDGAVGNA